MKTLSGVDATFLYLETPETPMHVGSLHLYQRAPGQRGSFHKAVQQHLAGRLHLSPIFTRKLAFMPLNMGHPGWIGADSVDMDHHVRRVEGSRLTVRQVEATAAKLHGQLMDRNRPLWEFYVFDSIKGPDGEALVGFYAKIHHAALDGKGGTVLANALLDLGPVPREVPPPDPARRARRESELKLSTKLGSMFSSTLSQYVKLAKSLPSAVSSVGSALARQSVAPSGPGGLSKGLARARTPLALAPKTLFNAAITPGRSFAAASIPFAPCRAMGKAVGGTFNDIVLWICATALRSYLQQHASIPKKPLLAAMPVSLREEGNTDMNTQASMSVVDLGTQYADPLKRLKAIMASTANVKTTVAGLKSVLPTDYPSLLAPWLVTGIARAAFKAYSATSLPGRLPMLANLAISNVPGPQVPLYLAGAKMLTYHPLSIVTHGLALNITIQTYAGQVYFGLIADKKAVPHLQHLADAIETAFGQAQTLYAQSQTAAVPVARPEGKKAVKKSVKTPSSRAVKTTQPKGAHSKTTPRTSAKRVKPATVVRSATAAKKKTRA